VRELGHLPGAAAHEPWDHPYGYADGYTERIVDHGVERGEALRRHEAVRR
jgi:deoxyribodipyrimidine photo-lyase